MTPRKYIKINCKETRSPKHALTTFFYYHLNIYILGESQTWKNNPYIRSTRGTFFPSYDKTTLTSGLPEVLSFLLMTKQPLHQVYPRYFLSFLWQKPLHQVYPRYFLSFLWQNNPYIRSTRGTFFPSYDKTTLTSGLPEVLSFLMTKQPLHQVYPRYFLSFLWQNNPYIRSTRGTFFPSYDKTTLTSGLPEVLSFLLMTKQPLHQVYPRYFLSFLWGTFFPSYDKTTLTSGLPEVLSFLLMTKQPLHQVYIRSTRGTFFPSYDKTTLTSGLPEVLSFLLMTKQPWHQVYPRYFLSFLWQNNPYIRSTRGTFFPSYDKTTLTSGLPEVLSFLLMTKQPWHQVYPRYFLSFSMTKQPWHQVYPRYFLSFLWQNNPYIRSTRGTFFPSYDNNEPIWLVWGKRSA